MQLSHNMFIICISCMPPQHWTYAVFYNSCLAMKSKKEKAHLLAFLLQYWIDVPLSATTKLKLWWTSAVIFISVNLFRGLRAVQSPSLALGKWPIDFYSGYFEWLVSWLYAILFYIYFNSLFIFVFSHAPRNWEIHKSLHALQASSTK